MHYVFPRRSLDPTVALASLTEAAGDDLNDKKGIALVWDVAYDWLADEIITAFNKASLPVQAARIVRPSANRAAPVVEEAPVAPAPAAAASCGDKEGGCCSSTPATSCGDANGGCSSGACTPAPALRPISGSKAAPALRAVLPPPGVDIADCAIWYLGPDGRSLLNLQMTHANHTVVAYSPDEGARQVLGSSRLLSRRLFALHQAMNADVFGLVVGNVGLASSRPLVTELRGALSRAGKKSYTLSVGRLNPAKLANFAEIECFVLIGCAEGGVVDSKVSFPPRLFGQS